MILVGHSYGGSLVSIAGADPKVSRLVYVAALQPDVGETAGQLLSKFPDRNTAVQHAGEGYLRLDPAKFAAIYAADPGSWPIRNSPSSVDQIAAEVGYAEGVTLRVLLRRRLGRGVREIRRSP